MTLDEFYLITTLGLGGLMMAWGAAWHFIGELPLY